MTTNRSNPTRSWSRSSWCGRLRRREPLQRTLLFCAVSFCPLPPLVLSGRGEPRSRPVWSHRRTRPARRPSVDGLAVVLSVDSALQERFEAGGREGRGYGLWKRRRAHELSLKCVSTDQAKINCFMWEKWPYSGQHQ